MQITLYKAAEAVRELLDQIDPETGELPPEYEKASAIVASKAQSVAAYILDTEAQCAMVEQHAKELLKRVKTQRRRSEYLREYLRTHMAAAGITSIKSDDGTFSAKLEIGRDESVEVFDAAQLTPVFLREVPATYEPDKTAIKAALKLGKDVPGARIVARDRLTLR